MFVKGEDVDEAIVRMMKEMYERTKTIVRTVNRVSQEFEARVTLFQYSASESCSYS